MKQQRNTRQKQMILEVVRGHGDHPAAEQICQEVQAMDERISRGTVYRNLKQLSELGEITHVKVPSADRYDGRLDFHYHLFCTGCGAVSDAPLAYQSENDRKVMEATGFQLERHRTIFEGLCPACQKKESEKR